MSTLPVTTAIVIAGGPEVERRLRGLFALLTDANIVVTVVSAPEEATAQLVMSDSSEVQCVLIDVAGSISGDDAAMTRFLDIVRAITAVPDVTPIVLATRPSADLVIQAFRCGAGDLIDLDEENDNRVTQILQRVADRYQERSEQRKRLRGMRLVLEDFFKNLVKTERRTIDLEHQLALLERGVESLGDFDPNRQPTVYIVEDDRDVADLLVEELEQANLTTYAFVSGEEAVANALKMAKRGEAIDLALVDARLPGMNGLQAIQQLREAKPNLAAILMTGFSDTNTAIGAADLGVVGYVLKPFDDIPGLIRRIKERAMQNMNSTRERHYLTQIKQRHEKILLRYRKLAADLERL